MFRWSVLYSAWNGVITNPSVAWWRGPCTVRWSHYWTCYRNPPRRSAPVQVQARTGQTGNSRSTWGWNLRWRERQICSKAWSSSIIPHSTHKHPALCQSALGLQISGGLHFISYSANQALEINMQQLWNGFFDNIEISNEVRPFILMQPVLEWETIQSLKATAMLTVPTKLILSAQMDKQKLQDTRNIVDFDHDFYTLKRGKHKSSAPILFFQT